MPETLLKGYEIIRCGDCGHERARPIEGQHVMACAHCGNELMQVWELEPTLCGTVRAGDRSLELHQVAA